MRISHLGIQPKSHDEQVLLKQRVIDQTRKERKAGEDVYRTEISSPSLLFDELYDRDGVQKAIVVKDTFDGKIAASSLQSLAEKSPAAFPRTRAPALASSASLRL